jgi:8-oxo-dGTP diphosphatase
LLFPLPEQFDPRFLQFIPKERLKRTPSLKKISTMIPVVALALVDPRGRVLMQRRPPGKAHGGLWEFPGGKVEAAESLDQALIREISEELGLMLEAAELKPLCFAALPGEPVVLLLYTCCRWKGEPQCHDAEEIGWFSSDELVQLAMPPLDVPLARSVALLLESVN